MEHFNQPFFASVFMILLTVIATYDMQDCFFPLRTGVGDYTVDCWDDEEHNHHLNIYCHNYLSNSLPDTIKIKLPIFAVISFSNCTFSEVAILRNIIDSMNIVYMRIGFMYCNNTPNRLNLQNLSAPDLFFDDSNIMELPYDLFYDVLDVRELQIARNQLTRIPKDFFSDWASNLRTVNLYGNKLRKIAKNDFARLVNVVKLNVNRNEIEEIEEGAFDNLIHLGTLILGANRMNILPSGIFHKLKNLTIINFNLYAENLNAPIENLTLFQMKSLPSDIFKGVIELRHIQLAGHDLRNLPVGLFADNKRLVKLILNNNGLESLPVGIFKDLVDLRFLDLTNNRLTTLPPELFIGLNSLEQLSVSMNNLTYVHPQFFENLKSTTMIDLSCNQITSFWHRNQSKNQKEFSVINKFSDIFENKNFPRETFLNLSFNRFSEFNIGLIDVVKYSNVIDLENNHVSTVNWTEFPTKTSNSLIYMGNNPFYCDCKLMDFIRFLNDSSYLSDNGESNFSKKYTCSSPPELKTRSVQKVHLEEFYCQFYTSIAGDACNETCTCREYPGKQVLFIDCSHRNLTQLPMMINNAYNWTIELNMSGNALQRTPSLNHSYLIKIAYLDLSHNNISEISHDVFSRNLRELKLHNNSISQFDPKVIEYLAHDIPLLRLTLHNNKLKCDCESHKILYGSIRKKLEYYNFHEMMCYGINRKVYEVAVSELCENKKILVLNISISLALFGIVVSTFAALYYKYQKQIKIWLYSRELCLSFVTDDELDGDKKYDAFISFAHKDEEFVEREIVAKLEEGPRPYKLCLHYRDWLAGEWIPLQISRSVADSRRTVIILTPNFLESVWGLVEFRTAHVQALKDGRARLIVVLHGEIENLDGLDPHLKDYLSMNTYIKWGDPWFWKKLKYALPHRPGNARKKDIQDTVYHPVNSENSASAADHIETISTR